MPVYYYVTNFMFNFFFIYYNTGENLLNLDVWMQKILITILYDNNCNTILT